MQIETYCDSLSLCVCFQFFILFFKIYFIYLFGCAGSQLRRTGSSLQHEGSCSLTRDRTWAPCIGSVASQPLDHQGSPRRSILLTNFLLYNTILLTIDTRTYLSCITETLCLWKNNFPFPPLPAPGNHHFTLCFYESDYF